MQHWDLAVIGTGPAGHFGAIQAAKLGKRVVSIEKNESPGGAASLTGTIPSKSLREATLHLTGLRQRTHYGSFYRVKDNLTIDDLTQSTGKIVNHETSVLREQMRRNGVETVRGMASFASSRELVVRDGDHMQRLEADKILVAVGSRPARPPELDFDGNRIFDSNQILALNHIPKQLIVVGAGVIGVEYACIFATLGTRVILINQADTFLEFVDRQVREELAHHMQNQASSFASVKKSWGWIGARDGFRRRRRAARRSPASVCSTASVGRATPIRWRSKKLD